MLMSRVMLRHNIDVQKGLVNGATGRVVKFEWSIFRRDQHKVGDLPTKVYVKFDHDIAGSDDNVWPISSVTSNFEGKKNTPVTREMIPLILAWSVNTHKLQGTTLDTIVVDLANNVFQKGLLYVAMSRCRTLSGLAISHLNAAKLLTTPHYTPCDEGAMQEMERLREGAGTATQNV
jgi:ATP-dependent exoDNAse (exonuclease V) alpha subunit